MNTIYIGLFIIILTLFMLFLVSVNIYWYRRSLSVHTAVPPLIPERLKANVGEQVRIMTKNTMHIGLLETDGNGTYWVNDTNKFTQHDVIHVDSSEYQPAITMAGYWKHK